MSVQIKALDPNQVQAIKDAYKQGCKKNKSRWDKEERDKILDWCDQKAWNLRCIQSVMSGQMQIRYFDGSVRFRSNLDHPIKLPVPTGYDSPREGVWLDPGEIQAVTEMFRHSCSLDKVEPSKEELDKIIKWCNQQRTDMIMLIAVTTGEATVRWGDKKPIFTMEVDGKDVT